MTAQEATPSRAHRMVILIMMETKVNRFSNHTDEETSEKRGPRSGFLYADQKPAGDDNGEGS